MQWRKGPAASDRFTNPGLRRFRLCLAAALLTAAPAAAGDAQGNATKGGAAFEDTTQVLEVEIPVNVMTRDGRPVRDLEATDFAIFDNGVRQEITGFRRVDFELLEGKDRQSMEKELPAAARRRLFLLFDFSFSDPVSITRARNAARRFVLESLHPTDLVAVAVHSLEQGAQLLVTFTSDRAQVVRAIDTLGLAEYSRAGRTYDPLRFIIDPAADPELHSPGAGGTDANNQQLIDHLAIIGERMARTERAFARNQISSWSRSLGEMAEHLDSVQGRKHVVLFSEGFDGRLLLGRQASADDEDLARSQQSAEAGQVWRIDTDQLYGNAKLKTDIQKMIEQFRRADCVIEAVDIAGLTADAPSATRAHNVGQDALFFIANETGGSLLEDANDLTNQLQGVLRRSQVTYLIAFQASDVEFEGRYHRLKVKGPRGTRLSHRDGYFEPREYQTLHPLEKSLLASDAIASAKPRDDIALEVVAVPFRGAPTVAYVPVIVEIDGPSLIAGTRGEILPLEIYAYPTDSKGGMPAYFSRFLELDLGHGTEILNGSGVKYYGHVVLETGEYLLRVLVRNSETGATGVKSVAVSVPKFDEEQIFLQPLFMETPDQWLMVREQSEAPEGDQRIYPFTVNGEPFVPAARPALTLRAEAQLCLITYGMGRDDLVLDGQVVTREGNTVEGGRIQLVERTVTGVRGLDKLVASFQPRGLGAGEYMLKVALTDSASGSVQVGTVPFKID